MNDASLIIVSQEVFLEADEGQGEIPWPWGLSQAVCVCVYVIVTQHDFVAQLLGLSTLFSCLNKRIMEKLYHLMPLMN